jgi:hypothetical protein
MHTASYKYRGPWGKGMKSIECSEAENKWWRLWCRRNPLANDSRSRRVILTGRMAAPMMTGQQKWRRDVSWWWVKAGVLPLLWAVVTTIGRDNGGSSPWFYSFTAAQCARPWETQADVRTELATVVDSLCRPRTTTVAIICIGSRWDLQLIAQVSILGSIFQLQNWRSERSTGLMEGCQRSASIR